MERAGYARGGAVCDPPGASTQRREAEKPAVYARGGGVKGKGGNRTQINIVMPHHGGAPAGPGAGVPVGPKPPMMAPAAAGAGLGAPPPPIGPGAKRGGRVGCG